MERSGSAWVLQRYVPRPMLARGAYKFHLRVMVLAVGDLKAGRCRFTLSDPS